MQIPKEIMDQLEFSVSGRADLEHDTQYPRLKPLAKPCEDCGRITIDRRVRSSKSYNQDCAPHVKHHCQSCKLYRNPLTGVYDCTIHDITRFYKQKKSKG